MIKTLLIGTTILMGAMSAANAAVVLTLNTTPSTNYQQQNNRPCVIGDPSCNNPSGFNSTTLAANPPADTYTGVGSPTYTVGQIRTLVGDTFLVGIDVNTTTSPLATEILDSFSLAINGVTEFIYTGPQQLRTNNNGNGFSDALLSGFNLSTFAAAATAQFFVTYHGATDGREEFFLVSSTTPGTSVPAPGALMLLGAGLAGLGALRRKKVA